MRAIEKTIKAALAYGSTCQLSIRDRVESNATTKKYYLWDSNIFSIHNDLNEVYFSFCGYQTNTTKGRINALLPFGSVTQKNWGLILTVDNEMYNIESTDKVHIDLNTHKVVIVK